MSQEHECDLPGLIHRLRTALRIRSYSTDSQVSEAIREVISLSEHDALSKLGMSIQIDPTWPDPGRRQIAVDLGSLSMLISHKGSWHATDETGSMNDESEDFSRIGPLLVLDHGEFSDASTEGSSLVQ